MRHLDVKFGSGARFWGPLDVEFALQGEGFQLWECNASPGKQSVHENMGSGQQFEAQGSGTSEDLSCNSSINQVLSRDGERQVVKRSKMRIGVVWGRVGQQEGGVTTARFFLRCSFFALRCFRGLSG